MLSLRWINSLTISKKLIERMYHMGIAVSYDRIMEIEDWLATSLSKCFEQDKCVTPASLRPALAIPPAGAQQHTLPESYANVPAVKLNEDNVDSDDAIAWAAYHS